MTALAIDPTEGWGVQHRPAPEKDPLRAFPTQTGVPRDAVEGPEVPGRVRKRRLHLCPVVPVLIHGRAQGLTR